MNNILGETGFWSRKECAYQFVHMFISFWFGYVAFKLFDYIPCLYIGLIIGFCVEFYQHYKLTWEEYKLRALGSIRDYCFWMLGVGLLLIVKHYPM